MCYMVFDWYIGFDIWKKIVSFYSNIESNGHCFFFSITNNIWPWWFAKSWKKTCDDAMAIVYKL